MGVDTSLKRRLSLSHSRFAALCSFVRAFLLGTASVPLLSLSLTRAPPAIAGGDADESSAYSFVLQQNGKPFPLSYLEGKVTVFVNVASECAVL